MYCKKCGKFIGNDADLCDECLLKEEGVFSEFAGKQETPTSAPAPTYHPIASNDSSRISLGKPIAAVILSTIGFSLIYFGLMTCLEILEAAGSELADIEGVIACILVGCIPCVLGLIFGIQSINHFKATSMIKSGKRIPVLILGIESVVTAGIGLFVVLLLVLALSLI